MQQELIAKRYVKPLIDVCDQQSLENLSELLTLVAESFKNDKFVQIMRSNDIAADAKQQLVLDMVAPAKSEMVNNLIKLLSENGRLNLIPSLASELTREIGSAKRTYKGRIYSFAVLDQSEIDSIASDLGKKMGATISLQFVPSECDGIRVEVDGLNVEIDFSKSRLNAQLVEHILKAI